MGELLSLEAVARICSVDQETVAGWWESGELKGFRPPGKDPLIPQEYLDRFMTEKGLDMGTQLAVATNAALSREDFDLQQDRAKMLAVYTFLPEHLRGKSEMERQANCLKIVEVSDLWAMSASMVADHSYVAKGGKLDFDGQLITGLINGSGMLSQPLNYEITGSGDDLAVVCSACFRGERKLRKVRYTLRQGRAQSPEYSRKKTGAWRDQPTQQLCYAAGRQWVRRHASHLLFGRAVHDEDATTGETEFIDESMDPIPQDQLEDEIAEAQRKAAIQKRRLAALEFYTANGADAADLPAAFGHNELEQITEAELQTLRDGVPLIRNGRPASEILENIKQQIELATEEQPDEITPGSDQWWDEFCDVLKRKQSVVTVNNLREIVVAENAQAADEINDHCDRRIKEIEDESSSVPF